MSRQIDISTFNKLNPGRKVVIDLDPGHKYLVLHIKRNFTAAQALNPTLKIEGKPKQSLDSLEEFEDLNTHFNIPQVAGVTSIFFNNPEYVDSVDRNFNGLGTADVRAMQFEFTLDAAVVAPTMEVKAEVTTNEPLGFIKHIEKEQIDILLVGKNVISTMPVGNGTVTSYFLKKPTQDITDIDLKRTIDSEKSSFMETTKEFLEIGQKQAPMRPRVPVTAKYTALDFTVEGLPDGAFMTDEVIIPGKGVVPVTRVSMDITVATIEPINIITISSGPSRG